MSESNNQDNTSKRTKNSENDETFYLNEDADRYATIEFSEEDLKQIRRPNPQPMDEDYFAATNQVAGSETVDTVEKEDDSADEVSTNISASSTQSMEEELEKKNVRSSNKSNTLEENSMRKEADLARTSDREPSFTPSGRVKEENSTHDKEMEDQLPIHSELEETFEIDLDEDLFHRHEFQKEVENAHEEENPFAYHSIENQLRVKQEAKRQTDERPNVFQKMLQTVFTPRGNRRDGTSDKSRETSFLAEEEQEDLHLRQKELNGDDSLSSAEDHLGADERVELTQTQSASVESATASSEIDADSLEEIKEHVTKRLDDKESDGRVVAVSPTVIEEYKTNSPNKEAADQDDSSESMEREMLIEDKDKEIETVIHHDEEKMVEPTELPLDNEEDRKTSEIREDDSVWEKVKTGSSQTWHKVSDKSSELWNTAGHSIKGWFDGQKDKDAVQEHELENMTEEKAETELLDDTSDFSTEKTTEADENLSKDFTDDLENGSEEKKTYTIKEILLNEKQTAVTETSTAEDPQDLQEGSVVELEETSAKDLADQVSQRTAKFSQPILTDAVLETTLGNQEDLTQPESLEKQTGQNFVSGAAWLSAGKILSRIIGVLYIIPWATWLGAQYSSAATLYSVGYKQYALLLAIATAGFPSAVAKQMAFFNSKREFNVADKLFKYSLLIMAVTGIVTSTLLFVFAPGLAAISATDDPQAATLVIRTLAPALLILPVMSLIRGYFQGFNDMIPTAVSEVIEQIIRVIYILAATYIVMVVMQGSVVQAVAHSTFAAFIGAVASLIYLVFVYLRFLPTIKQLKAESLDTLDVSFKESIRLMLYDSFPFILLGSGIIIAQNIDTFTFRQIMIRTSILLTSEISDLFGAMSLDVDKLIMIIVALAVALATSSIPAVSAKFAEGDDTKTGDLVKNILLVFTFVMLPASVGMATIANNIYPFFYPEGHAMGPSLLITGSIMSIALGAYTVLSAVLQSMNYRRQAVKYLVVGLLVKLLLQYPMVGLFHAHGAMIATTLAFGAISVLMAIKIMRTIKIRDPFFIGDLIRIIIGTVVMGFGASGWNAALNLLFGPVGRGLTFVKIMLVVIVAVFIYTAVMALFGMLSIVIGDYRSDLQERFSLNK